MDYSITLHTFTDARFLDTKALRNVHEYHTLLTDTQDLVPNTKCFRKTLNDNTD
jgi:hypothetical protein